MSFMNESTVDRAIRVVAGIVLLILGWGGVVEGTLGTVFQYLGFIPLLTGLAGWCPLYALGRVSTRGADSKEAVGASSR